MSDELNIEDVKKSLDALRKGHTSGGTNTTEVVSMTGQSGATQVFHTPNNSDPGAWAGSAGKDVASDGAVDGISVNGTDYDGRGIVKSLMEKVAKGQKLSANEAFILKSFMDAASKEDKKDPKDMDKAFPPKDEKDPKDMDKAFPPKDEKEEDEVEKSLQAGFEASDFLRAIHTDIHKSLQSIERNLRNHIDNRVNTVLASNSDMHKSIGAAVGSIGDVTLSTHQKIAQFDNLPVRGAKSHIPSNVVTKGIGNDGLENLSKSQIASRLADAVVAGKVSPTEVVKFETTGHLTPQLRDLIRA